MPALAREFCIIAPDLPGHGFTASPAQEQLSLPGMASALHALLQTLRARPAIVCGHSAGAAILLRMTLSHLIHPRVIISMNGALLPVRGVPRWVFSPMAKALARTSLVPRMLARHASQGQALERLLAETGSQLSPAGIDQYRQLVRQPRHVAAALGMMANWNLRTLAHELTGLTVPLVLVTGSNDRTIKPEEADRLARTIPRAKRISLDGLGHLAHEERPDVVARLLRACAADYGVLRPSC